MWWPLERVELPSRDRRIKEKRIRGIFPRYLFCQMNGERPRWGYVIRNEGGEEMGSVMRSPSGRPLVVPDLVMASLFGQCAPNGVIYPPEPRELHRKDKGRVTEGPLTGFAGVCSRTTRDRVWLLLEILGRPAEVGFRREVVEIA